MCLAQIPHPVIPGSFATAPGAMRGGSLVLGFKANWPMRRMLLQMLGVALLLCAGGLWMMNAEMMHPGDKVIRVGVCVVFFFLGMVLLTIRPLRPGTEVCFDPVRRELRVLRTNSQGAVRTILRRRYDSLGAARLTSATVQLFEADGSLLFEVPLSTVQSRSLLRDQLSGSVPLLT